MALGRRRSLMQPRIVVWGLSMIVLFLLSSIYRTSQLDIEDAIYLTKNSLKEFKEQYVSGYSGRIMPAMSERGNSIWRSELDISFEGLMNSFFPIDSLIRYNASDPSTGEIEEQEILGRYASFSPIVSTPIKGNYSIFPNDACHTLNGTEYPDQRNKIVVVLRGGCPFARKIENILKADINVKGIIVGNNDASRGLITMYANFMNEDFLSVPIIFITNDDYTSLQLLENSRIELTLMTASFGNWINIILSITLSPPLLILFLYLLVKNFRYIRRMHINRMNQELVKKLPVYVYNSTHLIKFKDLNNYLKVTGQAPVTGLSSADEQNHSKTNSSSSIVSNDKLFINGIDLKASAKSLHLLISMEDYFPAFKCSICLDRFYPLHSKVLVLSCKHIYHESCLSNWLINFKRSCPLCNKTLDKPRGPYLLSASETRDYGSTLTTDIENHAFASHTASDSQVDVASTASIGSELMTSQVEPTSSSSTNAILNSLTDRSATSQGSVSASILTGTSALRETSSGPTSFFSAFSHLGSSENNSPFVHHQESSHMPIMSSTVSASSARSSSTRYYTLESGQSDADAISYLSDNHSDSTIHLEPEQNSHSSHPPTP